ncbi:uncharacterized protein LOC126176925 [Schistocerca cancellata]|uniref:uncharacterized protein LOC126176925 n=1 Tax=Schistocerca cancellata TaxID=274614 RepID=UPI0021196C8C|nr:uncharacterized protein LOC126176925 [Schistocerca cancellata]XP_049780069.1 uncharacterized protein LOC126176925 [Schistocerca cancellata]
MSESNAVTQLNVEGESVRKNESSDSKECSSLTRHPETSQAEISKDSKIDELIGSVEKISLGDELQHQLDALQCPFTWEMKDMLIHKSPVNVITRLEEKEEELDGEEGAFLLLRQCGLQLALCYENWYKGDIAAARERQHTCDSLIENEDAPYLDGLKHISRSCAVHLAYLSGMVSDARTLLKKVIPFKELNDVSKACVVGMRGIVLMEYGYQGTSQSVPYIEQALELDPSSAEWHFLLGKSLRRLRRLNAFNEIPDKRELKALEKAVEMSQCSGYCTFLAQTYRETAFRVYSLNRNDLSPFKQTLDIMNEKAAEYYRKSLMMAPDSSHINIRCALGFLTLPFPYRDVKLAKSCIDKALKLAPNNTMAHHVEGKYFERIGDLEAAKSSYKTSGEYGAYGAYMDYLRLEFKTNPKFDPAPLFKKMMEVFIEEPYRVGTLSQIGCYYYLIENKLKEAVTYWLQIIDEKHDTARLRAYKPVCVFIKKPFDLLQVALDEVRLALCKENVPSEERDLYERLISKFEGTELLDNPPESHRQQILEESESVLREEEERASNSRGRERGGKRGRGNYQEYRGGRGRGRGNYQDYRGRGRGTSERGTGRGSGYYHSSNRRDSSCESNSSSRRYRRDSSCESNNSSKDWRTIRNRRPSEEESRGPNYEFRSSSRNRTSQKEFRRGGGYRGSYDRDSSCDSTGSQGSIQGRGGSRRQFQDRDGDYDRMRGSSNCFQRDTKFNWREGAAVREPSYERQEKPNHYSPRNRGNWRERPSNNHERNDRGSYGDSSRGNRQAYRNHSYNRNRDSSADSYSSDNLGERYKKEYSNQNFRKYRHESGSDHVKQEDSSFNRRFKLAQTDDQQTSKDSRSARMGTGGNDEIQQKLRARKEMSLRMSDQNVNKNEGRESST